MKLPFWRTKSAAPSPRIPSWATPWQGGEPPRSYEAQVRDSFLTNPVAARAIRMITESAGGAPVVSAPGDHPALALLHSCGFGASGPGLLETLAGHMLLHGNAYVDVAVGSDGLPAALFALRPERVSVEVDGEGWPAAYVYRAGTALRRYPVAAAVGGGLLHIRSFHPTDDHHGAGCLGAASSAVAVHNAATRWNKALLDNAARPSGALVYGAKDGERLTAEQFEALRAQVAESHAGRMNAGRPMILEGGLDWKPMSWTPADMDFIAGKHAAAREIALAFGVPPQLLGIPGDATYANYREANAAFWRGTVVPLVRKTAAALTVWLGGRFAGVRIEADLEALPALQPERDALWARLNAAGFLTDEERRRMAGVGD